MRLTQVVSKRWPARRVNENSYPIPFQALYPIELEDRFTDQMKVERVRPCVPQLTVVLQCFKDHDFNQKKCTAPLEEFYECMAQSKIKEGAAIKNRKLSDVKHYKDLTQLEASKLLKSKPLV